MELNIIIQHGEDGWITGQLEEVPAVIEQGKTLDELKVNLRSALDFYWETQRILTEKQYEGLPFTRTELLVA